MHKLKNAAGAVPIPQRADAGVVRVLGTGGGGLRGGALHRDSGSGLGTCGSCSLPLAALP